MMSRAYATSRDNWQQTYMGPWAILYLQQYQTYKLYTPSFLSVIQAKESFHALYVFPSLVDSGPDTSAKGIYLSHSIQKRDEKIRKQDENTKTMRYALRP